MKADSRHYSYAMLCAFWIIALLVSITEEIADSDADVEAKTVTLVGAPSSASAVRNLVRVYASDEEHMLGLLEGDSVLKSLKFDKFDEETTCKILKEIQLEYFDNVVDDFVKLFELEESVKSRLIDGKYANENIYSFRSERRVKKEGSFLFGRVSTVRHGKKIDMTYSVYQLEFKLHPPEKKAKNRDKRRKFLGFTLPERKIWRESHEKGISDRDERDMYAYFVQKAIYGFKEKYSSLIESEVAMSYCSESGCEIKE